MLNNWENSIMPIWPVLVASFLTMKLWSLLLWKLLKNIAMTLLFCSDWKANNKPITLNKSLGIHLKCFLQQFNFTAGKYDLDLKKGFLRIKVQLSLFKTKSWHMFQRLLLLGFFFGGGGSQKLVDITEQD